MDSPTGALSKRFNNASFVSQSSIGRRNGRVTKSIDMSHLNRLAKREGPYVLHREGKIREIANLTNLDENYLENEILNSLSKANRKESTLYNNQAMSRGGFRYYVGKGPNIKQLEQQSLEIEKIKQENNRESNSSLFPVIQTTGKKRRTASLLAEPKSHKDPSLIIQNESITQRYLTRNVFQGNRLPPKESVRESIENLRKIQYSTIQIRDKSLETERLSEHIVQEKDKLEDAWSKFNEDKDNFK